MTPEFTKPTTMTVVAVELWMTQVTPMPTSRARKRLSATDEIQRLRRAPASAWSPSERKRIPSRKMPMPPRAASRTSRKSWLMGAAFYQTPQRAARRTAAGRRERP